MRRFLVAPEQISNNRAFLCADEARHALQVLRLGPGERVELLDGNGSVFEAVFDSLTKSKGELTLVSCREEVGPIGRLTIVQALLKGKKMEFLVQKATELGVDALQPITTARSTPPGRDDRNERLKKISLQACKQCGRSRPLTILPLAHLDDFLKEQQEATNCCRLFFWEEEKKRGLDEVQTSFRTPGATGCILIGPEGGFSRDEAVRIMDAEFLPVGLGQRTLRAETASITAMVLGQLFLGNLEPEKGT